MHVQRLTVQNIRSVQRFDLDLRGQEGPAGWHVILGDNGAGKSTVVRALALAFMGQQNAYATREDWSRWLAAGRESGCISVELSGYDEDRWTGKGRISGGSISAKASFIADSGASKFDGHKAAIKFHGTHANRTVWGGGEGWFAASFGPFRRFSGGDREMDRLFLSHPRLASHLSAFGENVALGESLLWLTNLQIKILESDHEAAEIQDAVIR